MDPYVEALEEAVKQYIGLPVLNRIKSDHKKALELSQQNIDATFLFMDIKLFTQIIRKTSPDTVISELNNYLSMMSEIIIRHNGFIDSFIGDAIFAIFGISNDNHAGDACSAALECLNAIKVYNKNPERKIPFEIGIGINSGTVILGNIGSVYKLKFTAIGDMVNIASRMVSLTGQYKCDIIITESTKNHLKKGYNIKNLGNVSVKGIDVNINIYSLE